MGMTFVMLPVPEEIADEVRSFVAYGLIAADNPGDNPDAVLEVLDEGDDDVQRLLRLAAECAIRDDLLSLTDAARRLDMTVREVFALVAELNHGLRIRGGALGVMTFHPDPRPRPDDRSEWAHRTIRLDAHQADLVRQA